MAHSDDGIVRRTGMPSPSSVVTEKMLLPRRRATAFAAGLARGGTVYRILRTNEVDPYDEPLSQDELRTFGLQRFAVAGETYRGTARKAAKIAIADAETEPFDDLRDLIQTLPAEADMTAHQPPITTDRDSGRVDEERRNVRLRAFLYAASRESDNDFHLIVGRDPNAPPSMYMTMEISGLPPRRSADFTRLKSARGACKAFFGDDLPGASYDFYDPPIPVEIQGSLFFDMSHATGPRPGPQSLRQDMPTIWEIHPISEIVFEP
jgi:hypothetical protein